MDSHTILLSGVGSITPDANGRMVFEFHPDDPQGQELARMNSGGMAQLMRSGTFYFVPSKPRVRNNALLICKAAHGRLSGTRDHGVQLTLKVFSAEHIDWQRAFVSETVELMAKLMGSSAMNQLLYELIARNNTTL